jgi:predicted lipoprotein with Yx(FWY)xxD motif
MPGLRPLIPLAMLMVVLAGCSAAVATPGPTTAPAPTAAPASVVPSAAPATVAPATAAPTAAPAITPAPSVAAPTTAPSSAGGTATVMATSVGSIGTALVAASNGMTVYQFTKDTKDSGKSACSGGCLKTWPALTVAAGVTPKAGPGVTGTLGTIKRADDGVTQVTYNGLPLYFFSGDSKPGDSNGVYPNWMSVKP